MTFEEFLASCTEVHVSCSSKDIEDLLKDAGSLLVCSSSGTLEFTVKPNFFLSDISNVL